jgi:5-methylcytosine-specific restriction protein A
MAERLRGRAGQRQRMERLKRLGVTCARCGRIGAWRKAEASEHLPLLIVDHIVPLAKGGADVDSNLRLLCEEPCHREVTAEQFGMAAAPRYRGVGRDGRPTSADHPWNRR